MKKEVNNEEKKNKKSKAKKALKWIAFFLIFQIIYVPILSIVLIYYGPFTNTRDMIVTTAMTTMRHQYFATLFLSKEKNHQDFYTSKQLPPTNSLNSELCGISSLGTEMK